MVGLPQRAFAGIYRIRRRLATTLAIFLAVFLAYHVVFGRNGLNNYEQKRAQDKVLRQQIEALQQQNQQLQIHNAHLKNDPDAIEFEARQKLHYAKPGEVIYKLNNQQSTGEATTSAPSQNVN